MANENQPLTEQEARHLLRRTGFGAKPKEVAKYVGRTRSEAAIALLEFRPKAFMPRGQDDEVAHGNWIKYMIRASSGLNEKLTLFWHDHFATAYSTVSDVKRMGLQNKLLRQSCKGDFKELVKRINKDPAMMKYLDTVRNVKKEPNENYARELQELFTLGVKDLAGNDNYTQEDVRLVARAFTGWTFDGGKNVAYFRSSKHDYTIEYNGIPGDDGEPDPDPEPDRGPKVIYKDTGGFLPAGQGVSFVPLEGEGEGEIDQVVEVIFQHRDSDGRNTVARRTARRLLEFFVHGGFAAPDPSTTEGARLIDIVDEVVDGSGFATSWNLEELLRRILSHDEFYASLTDPSKKSIRWPVDFAVGTMRLLNVKPRGAWPWIPGGEYAQLIDHMANMGQVVLDPPSVFGWDWEAGWVSSAALLARYAFARDVAAGDGGFKPGRLVDLKLTDPEAIVDRVTDALGVTDDLAPAERDALLDYLTDGGTVASLDLGDYWTRSRKLHGLVTLVLQSPAYQLQ